MSIVIRLQCFQQQPNVIIKVDISNVLNTECRVLTRTGCGYTSLDYEVIETTCVSLSNLLGYFRTILLCYSKVRYFDWDGQVHLTKGKTGGHQGNPHKCS